MPLDEVEPAAEIVKRFKSGGMSLGALSPEAHETLAVGMNRLGGKSNTGEGGEDPARFGDERRSSIKQVASGPLRRDRQLPRERRRAPDQGRPGRQARRGRPAARATRSTATSRGCATRRRAWALISPPPHHDIYSIEDLKQLIYDLRCANPRARVSVKLVSEVGVGTVAAGVAKANADHVVIAGPRRRHRRLAAGVDPARRASPGRSASPRPSRRCCATTCARASWSRSTARCAPAATWSIGAILGADEFGFSTAPLIALGCVMMRVCHLNTCPVGVATQDPELRERFEGQPEHVVNYLFMVAEEARRIMARARRAQRSLELIGRTELLDAGARRSTTGRRSGIDLRPLLAVPRQRRAGRAALLRAPRPTRCSTTRSTWTCSSSAARAIEEGRPRAARAPDREQEPRGGRPALGRDRAPCTARRACPRARIDVHLTRLRRPELRRLAGARRRARCWTGDANDYCGKGLSGGTIVVRPPDDAALRAPSTT